MIWVELQELLFLSTWVEVARCSSCWLIRLDIEIKIEKKGEHSCSNMEKLSSRHKVNLSKAEGPG